MLQLEAMIRLAEARAKAELREVVTERDARVSKNEASWICSILSTFYVLFYRM